MWPLSRPFRISRGVKSAADVVVAEVAARGKSGRGECVPYARYGDSSASVLAQIEAARAALEAGVTREDLQALLPPGAARNALDCALWDLEAKQAGISVADRLGVRLAPIATAVTVSLDAPERMHEAARAIADAPLIKVKVSADAPLAAVDAVRRAAPSARLIVDPNEGWSPDVLLSALPRLADFGVALIEQPVPASDDDVLDGLAPPVPICADEAAHTRADLDRVARRYQAVNVKLDKAGGLTEALAMAADVRARGLQLMIGCMVSTSLSIAPALMLAHDADFVDLDGPWWLSQDRPDAMRFADGVLTPPCAGWGYPA